VVGYAIPETWILYDACAVAQALAEAKAAVLSLRTMPYQRSWVEGVQEIELKREIAGTSRIEGADFTERELDQALRGSPDKLVTRSQRQAHAAVKTYRWIGSIPDDRPMDEGLVREIHRSIVTHADDDHCPPGRLRERDQNVVFGNPRHRGAEGGEVTDSVFKRFTETLQREYKDHDGLIQALAAHYHLAAMHPFLDGNGRTARALEALMLQRSGLRDTCFIPMSTYYYDEKQNYLKSLNDVRAAEHDLTPFLIFGLEGIRVQSLRLLSEMARHVSKALFRNVMFEMFNRLRSPRRRVIVERQIEILKLLLEADSLEFQALADKIYQHYTKLKNPWKAVRRDLIELEHLKAITVERHGESGLRVSIRLEWPTEITETEFFKRIKQFPKARSHSIFQ